MQLKMLFSDSMQEEEQKKHNQEKQQDIPIAAVIIGNDFPIFLKKIPNANQDGVPNGNPCEGGQQKGRVGLPERPSHKGNVGAAEGNHPANADCEQPVFFKGLVGGLKGLGGFWETGGKLGNEVSAAFFP